ncbi:NaeI family type II restriction endonuclease [Streptomyces desertarenae]|uniref:NaeI family type II restriction endonuclease n=1 Tax=Streptomyces desertarenae TaxID=2666184 RepID=A0ABW4PS92_9ACTN
MSLPEYSHPALPFDIAVATSLAGPVTDDPELLAVRDYLLREDPEGRRFATVLRNTIDQLLDGENTGRYDWRQLHKTEKTHAGTLVEINLQREFQFKDGQDMDYSIEGIDVDCKFSQRPYGWMIPPEALDELCLVVWADDHLSQWSAGLLRASREIIAFSENITRKGNRDRKIVLKKEHRGLVHWLWEKHPLPENLLLHIAEGTRRAIFDAGASSRRSVGQARVSELFRRVQQRRISRTAVRTLAQQKDYMKRVRYNGGARTKLRPDGIVIFGDYPSHQEAAERLGIPVPQEGEFVSVRVARARADHGDRPRVRLDGEEWVVADGNDPVEKAPLVPETRKGHQSDDD